ncbi:YceI family protein [Mycetocola tolaasinivorans]|uniref:YceI family protein n=1 Tax=Mycetocola tolaasinivorans TaxID=76635 RepID=A0A3L7A9B0_9MICO|nr:YceI family protein [Mycetocola tolaasinivorans]RLP76919.1 YceI family protein [Mycetocola tolaasinivorans]
MKKKSAIILASIVGGALVLGGVAFAVGPTFYRDNIAAKPSAEPTAAIGALGGSTLTPDQLAGTWNVAKDSTAGYRVKEVLNGTDVTVTGRTSEVTGSVEVTGTGITAGTVNVDVSSIATDSAQRDNYFRNNVVLADAHPTATFTLTSPVALPTNATTGEHSVQVTGTLELAGKTRDVTATVTAGLDGSTAKIAGSIPITFADFGMEAPSLGFVKVEPAGSVEFLLQLSHG